MMIRRLWTGIAVFALAGCPCSGRRGSQIAYAPMESYAKEIAACVGQHDCHPLCAGLFQLEQTVKPVRCTVTSVVAQDLTLVPAPIEPSSDVQSMRGANVTVTYVDYAACGYVAAGSVYDGWDDGADGWDDGSSDDGSCDDGSCDDSCDDGSCDDSCDDGSCDDGGWGDDGSGDDGGGDDGGGGGGGDDGGFRRIPPPPSTRGDADRRQSVRHVERSRTRAQLRSVVPANAVVR